MLRCRHSTPWPRVAAVVLVAACSSQGPSTAPEFKADSPQPLSVMPQALSISWPLARPTFVATVQYYTSFTASGGSCASVSPTSSLPVEPSGSPKFSATFTITPTSEGTCAITVTDKKGNQAQVTVTVHYPTLAFDRRVATSSLAIFTMKADGSGVTQLTTNPTRDFDPSWSRDGSRIAFTSDRDGPTPPLNFEVYVMNADGTNQVRYTNSPGFDQTPVWFPDDSKIAFMSDRDLGDGSQIFVMEADGSNQTALTTEQAQQPDWSPDGSRIVFASNRVGGLRIWGMNADGTDQHPITPGPNNDDQMPAWSPDGTKIAFSSRRMGDGSLQIYTMNPDGSNVTQLTDGLLDTDAAWSPDGSGIAYSSFKDNTSPEIWIMNADGSGKTRLTFNDVQDTHPAWKP